MGHDPQIHTHLAESERRILELDGPRHPALIDDPVGRRIGSGKHEPRLTRPFAVRCDQALPVIVHIDDLAEGQAVRGYPQVIGAVQVVDNGQGPGFRAA